MFSLPKCGFLALFVALQPLATGLAADILIEAESAQVHAPFVVAESPEASHGQYLWAPDAVAPAMRRTESAGSARYEVVVPESGTYELWGKVFTPGAPRTRPDSFYIALGGEELVWRIHDWADNWVWRRLTTEDITEKVTFNLSAGTHLLTVGHRTSSTQLDQLKLVRVGAAGEDPSDVKAHSTKVYTDLSPYFEMPPLEVPTIPARDFLITDFGAKAGGQVKNTEAFAKAIAAASEAGGGRIVVPEGEWLTGPIHLKSNIDLHLSKGATLLFSTDRNDYLPMVFSRWEGMELYNYSAPIYANGVTNIAITGEGTLNGQGQAWWDWKTTIQKDAAYRLYNMIVAGKSPEERRFGNEYPGLRPNFINLMSCRRILIENVTIVNGPMWTIHPVYCNEMIVRGVKVKTVGPNNDGINPDSTQNLLIEDCYFSTGDDCIVLKSGLNEDGWRVGRPTQNVVIRRIYGNEGHGGIVVGSEMSGGVRNVYAHDCTFVGTDRGIRVKSMPGRGAFVENFWVERLKLKDMGGQAIRLNQLYTSSTVKPLTKVPPVFRNFNFRDITCEGAACAVELIGLEDMPIQDITLENLKISANQGFVASNSTRLKLINVDITPKRGPAFDLQNVTNLTIKDADVPPGEEPLVRVKGEQSAKIMVEGPGKVEYAEGAKRP